MAQLDTFNDKAGYWTSPDWQTALNSAGIAGRTSGAIRTAIATAVSEAAAVQGLYLIAQKFDATFPPPPVGTSYQTALTQVLALCDAQIAQINASYLSLAGLYSSATDMDGAWTNVNPVVNNCLNAGLGLFTDTDPVTAPPAGVYPRILAAANQTAAWSADWRPWAAADSQLTTALSTIAGATPANVTLANAASVEATGNWS